MATIAADRNLLFGLPALQNSLVDQVQLVAAFQAWTLDKSRHLAEILVWRGDLNPVQRELLEALAEQHLEKHGKLESRTHRPRPSPSVAVLSCPTGVGYRAAWGVSASGIVVLRSV